MLLAIRSPSTAIPLRIAGDIYGECFSSFTFTLGQTLANPTLNFHTLDLAFLDAMKGKFTETSSIYSSITTSNTFYFYRCFRSLFNP